eukprot:CAMPEP_0198213136 /NCGR_PEP_ID=MMETSP1445-20131203/28696_1 /TAXON_ID=36898 /ORGANISM="Pyramimonas sp., Strain CCMP2087" /LENGTH=92 /DNA_ID=CAMNT_0043887737 /DNA_START=306 /DNA_END=584 /DNA_ORIENTATION=+
MAAQEAAVPDDHVVPNLHKVVDLDGVANDRVPPATSVHATVGADLHVVTNDHVQQLRFFHHRPRLLVHQESEPVLSNADAVVKNARGPNGAI